MSKARDLSRFPNIGITDSDIGPVDWTPVLTSNGTTTLDTEISITDKWAYKTGNMIDAHSYFNVTAINTVGNGSLVIIDGLPFPRANLFLGNIRIENVDTGNTLYCLASQYGAINTAILPIRINNNSAISFIAPGDISVGVTFELQIRYKT